MPRGVDVPHRMFRKVDQCSIFIQGISGAARNERKPDCLKTDRRDDQVDLVVRKTKRRVLPRSVGTKQHRRARNTQIANRLTTRDHCFGLN